MLRGLLTNPCHNLLDEWIYVFSRQGKGVANGNDLNSFAGAVDYYAAGLAFMKVRFEVGTKLRVGYSVQMCG